MGLRIVLLSGHIATGKSELAKQLAARYGAVIVRTRDLIKKARPKISDNRAALQAAGATLDRQTKGAWVKGVLAEIIDEHVALDIRLFVIDAVRIKEQIDAIRDGFGTAVYHIHLNADGVRLEERYNKRNQAGDSIPYERAREHRTEGAVSELARIADIVVQTDRCDPDEVCVRATALLGLYPRTATPMVDVLVGGQYGSEGKGNIVGHIAPEYRLLVRVGGPNAGHQVFAEPKPEKYYHLPSGTGRAPEAKLLLGAGAVLYVPKLLEEIQFHKVSDARLSIDHQAMIIEDYDREFEAELRKSISSTAQGVGAASARKINYRGAKGRYSVRLAKDIGELKPFIRDSQEVLEAAYQGNSRILLEGTQGTSLSIHHGPYPYVTSRDTTVAGCLADAGIAPRRVRRIVMVCRTYPIRVGGKSGPMRQPLTYKELSHRSGISQIELRRTERTTTTNRQRRICEFDWAQLHKSTVLNGPTDIAITFADYLGINNRKAYRYEQLNADTLKFIEEVERVSGVRVSMISTNFHWRNVIDRRAW